MEEKRNSGKGKKIFSTAFINVYAFISSILCLYPIFWLLYSSMKTATEFDMDAISLPKHPSLTNYALVIETVDMFRYILNSAIIAVCSVFLIILFSFILGYFLSRFKFRGKRLILAIFMVGLLMPTHSLMVPIYIIFSRLNLNDHLLTLVLPYLCFQLPIGLYLVESYVHSIPPEMEESATIDGASFSRTLFSIIFPMTMPILVTVGIISFFFCWNEFSFALILINKMSLRTVPLGLTLFNGAYITSYPEMMAAMVIATIPTLILYILFSRRIMDGMVAGAIKG